MIRIRSEADPLGKWAMRVLIRTLPVDGQCVFSICDALSTHIFFAHLKCSHAARRWNNPNNEPLLRRNTADPGS